MVSHVLRNTAIIIVAIVIVAFAFFKISKKLAERRRRKFVCNARKSIENNLAAHRTEMEYFRNLNLDHPDRAKNMNLLFVNLQTLRNQYSTFLSKRPIVLEDNLPQIILYVEKIKYAREITYDCVYEFLKYLGNKYGIENQKFHSFLHKFKKAYYSLIRTENSIYMEKNAKRFQVSKHIIFLFKNMLLILSLSLSGIFVKYDKVLVLITKLNKLICIFENMESEISKYIILNSSDTTFMDENYVFQANLDGFDTRIRDTCFILDLIDGMVFGSN
ncbi:hypothetical protein EDEG_02658 [Edhazardia aedis USNM 41457]|uniref:Uncharacterized protein n=1 Tax=Edhazardia aedis (strain USNM 41457) TaxID=1003232 RepID=J9D574_EDHAE|nr:hypothetical protein EDEG_02658 [Edhazardia aedis USNM 41457]|eukprot:EJW02956.1 hypothetical protein EDEG_02658 [Edhazardia aedis USNM 41457]